MLTDPLDLVRATCLALPEVTERLSHGAPSFFVRDKKTFVMFMDDDHGDGRLALWCAAQPGAQELMLAQDPARFFRPPYVGHRGWLGVRVDGRPDWADVEAVITEAYRAPSREVPGGGARRTVNALAQLTPARSTRRGSSASL